MATSPHPAARLATLLAALATLPAPAAAAVPDRALPALHLSFGTGACPAARSPLDESENPCWLHFGAQLGARFRPLEAAVVYEGREPLDLLSGFALRPMAATVLGGAISWITEPGAAWRLSLGGEMGWRRYQNFAGARLFTGRSGAADTAYAGATGRLGFGLRPQAGRSDRMELTLAWRQDLRTAAAEVDGVPWRVGGWSITMGVGIVTEW